MTDAWTLNPMSEPAIVELALRCYPVLVEPKERTARRRRRSLKPPQFVLVLDTETVPDDRQALTFGSYRGYQRCADASDAYTYDCIEEGLFYADNAPLGAIERLRRYARTHAADTSVNGRADLPVRSQREFIEEFFYFANRARAHVGGFNLPFDLSRLSYDATETRKGIKGGFSLVLGLHRDPTTGGLYESRYRPRITIKTINAKASLKQFTRVEDELARIPDDSTTGLPERDYYFRGNFLELRTVAFTLTDRGHTLDSACKAFNVERKGDPGRHLGWDFDDAYIDYNRRDTRITGELLFAMLREYAHHPIGVAPTELYSPASIGKGYLDAMRLTPLLDRWPSFPKDELGFAMSTFYGGRTSARIRRFLVPVRYCDFLSMYPTVNALLRTWDLLTAADYAIVDVTDRARTLLESLTLDRLFDSATWPQLGFFAQVVPQGDVLPVRTKWEPGDARQIGINPLTAGDLLWYAGPDLAASVLLAGKVPHIERAFAIDPARDANGAIVQLKGLRTVRLLGSIPVDPRHDNFFLKVIEERQRARNDSTLTDAARERFDKGLKVIANASSYGILAQMDPVDLKERESKLVDVYGALGSFRTRTTKPEKPGDYFFPPIAALITAGARCMLAMLERCVTDRGGTYAMEDTDSMAIVATPEGGLVPCPGGPHPWTRSASARYRGPKLRGTKDAVRALSFAEVDAIVAQFTALNLYDRSVVPDSILKVEKINVDELGRSRQVWCYAISSKRYALFTLDERGEPHVARDAKSEAHCSEHGLGHLLNPTDVDSDDRGWIVQTWETIAREHLGLPVAEPPWLDRPALTRLSVSTPYLWRPFARAENGRPYPERIKPFNFLLAAHVAPLGFPTGVDPARFLLVAPYELDPTRWPRLTWTDVHSGHPFGVTTDPEQRLYHPERALVQTYRATLAAFRLHPEPKSLRADGQPCDELHRDCAGLLRRRPALVPDGAIEHVSKEMNELDDVLAGVVHDEDRIVTRYVDPRRATFDRFRVLLRAIPKSELVERTGLSARTIEMVRRGRTLPHPDNQDEFLRAVIEHFSERPAPTFETIERLDRNAIDGEVRELARRIREESAAPIDSQEARGRAREEVARGYNERLRAALALLGI